MHVHVKYDPVLWKKWTLFNSISKRAGLINLSFIIFLGSFKTMFSSFFKYLFHRALSIWFTYSKFQKQNINEYSLEKK